MKNTLTRSLFALFILIFLFGCAPAAAPTRIAAEPAQPDQYSAPVEAQNPAATYAPPSSEEQPDQPYSEPNYFQDYGTNPEEDATWDNLSTFGLDVDTASYTVARRQVMDGNLPPYDAVRVEEFINYFQQDYPTPAGMAFGIYADGALSPFYPGDEYLLRFGIQGYREFETDRKPLNLVFVIDVSGSMDLENRLGLVKRSLELLVKRLNRYDTVGIVAYGSIARVVLQPTPASDQRQILNAINKLRTGGSTNAEAGLRIGFRMARANYDPGAANRVILCSDGVANTGSVTAESILGKVDRDRRGEIPLNSYGFGMGNFNDVLMEQLADQADGSYAYVDTLDEAQKLFVEQLTTGMVTIARDAKVQVDFNPNVVASYRLLGYENRAIADQDFRDDSVDAGELGPGHSATALYIVKLVPQAEGRIATVQLRWQDPDSREVKEINGNFNTWDLAERFDDGSPRFQLDVLVAYYAGLLRQEAWSSGATWDDLVSACRRVARLLPDDADAREFADLVQRASRLAAWE